MAKKAKISRKYTYTAAALERCLQEIRHKIPINTACRRYGIPRSTVKFKLSRKCKQQSRCGPPTVLSAAEEKVIVEWTKKMARKGFPVTRCLVNVVTTYLEKNPTRNTFKNGKPSQQWMYSFLGRNKDLSLRTPESVTNASANVTELDIRRWFKEVHSLLEEEDCADILQDPKRVLNGDETSFYLDPTVDKVIAKREERNVYKVDQGPAKKNVTVMFTCTADGEILPPMVVVAYKKIPIEVTQSVPAEWGIGKSDSGWMNKDCFLKYIRKILHPQLVERGVLPVIYFVDGHSSHTAWETAEECQKLGIILVCLYPNTTRILQPLDVAVFKPMKVAWLKTVADWKIAHPNKYLKTEQFAPLLTIATAVVDAQIVKNGFETCGLYPWNEDRVDYSKCIANAAPVDPIVETDDINPEVRQPATKQCSTFPVMVSQAEEIIKMLGSDRISRYKQLQNDDFASDDDKTLYHVFTMLEPLESRVCAIDEDVYEAYESLSMYEIQQEMEPDSGQVDNVLPADEKQSSEKSWEKFSIEDRIDYSDFEHESPVKMDPLPELNYTQFEMVLLPNDNSEIREVKEDIKPCNELSNFLETQTPHTPHRKGTLWFKHRSPAVLTSRRRLEYHKLKAEEKAKAEADKRQKAELRAQKKAENEAKKKKRCTLRKNIDKKL